MNPAPPIDPHSREEVAKREVGHTDVSPALARAMTAAFLATILFVPLADLASATARAGQRTFLSIFPTAQDVRTIAAARGPVQFFRAVKGVNNRVLADIRVCEKRVAEDSGVAGAIVPRVRQVLIGTLRAGSEQVYQGREGWLFYRPEIDYLAHRGFLEPRVMERRRHAADQLAVAPEPDPVKAILEFKAQLAERGIDLWVLPAPSKAMIHPERYSARYAKGRTPLENPSYPEFARRLVEGGVTLIDAAGALSAASRESEHPLYLASDTHWTPAGARAVAQALAARVRQAPKLSVGPQAVYERRAASIENIGDLARMLKLPSAMEARMKESAAIEPVHDPSGAPAKPDPAGEILFLGDSFANIYSFGAMGWGENAGIVEQLAAELGRPVDAILMNDNGAYATRRELSRQMNQGRDRLAGKKLVVWEFAARELAVGDWKTGFDLKLGEAREIEGAAVPAGARTILATVAAAAQVPAPGSVPYKDCLIALHLRDAAGGAAEPEVVAFIWGMRENKLEPAAAWRPGDEVNVTIVPWSGVEAKYGSFNRVELDDPALLALPTYWAEIAASPPAQDAPPPEPAAEPPAAPAGAAAPAAQNEPNPAAAPAAPPPAPSADSAAILKALAATAARAEAEGKNVLAGEDGWLFFVPELRSLGAGKFWGPQAAGVARATNKQFADPLPAILDFKKQLDSIGVELILAPVPPKALIYADKLGTGILGAAAGAAASGARFDSNHLEFYALLRGEGVHVLDLAQVFLAARASETASLYCMQDSHWSGEGIRVAARAISEAIGKSAWAGSATKSAVAEREIETDLTGDLWEFLADPALPKERLEIWEVGAVSGSSFAPVSPSRESPLVLLGDSHNLVFHAGDDMHAKSAGLPDHLARALGFPVDLVGVRGSGATPARVNLMRRGDNLKGKRAVVWCFSFREFTESPTGWPLLPVVKPAP